MRQAAWGGGGIAVASGAGLTGAVACLAARASSETIQRWTNAAQIARKVDFNIPAASRDGQLLQVRDESSSANVVDLWRMWLEDVYTSASDIESAAYFHRAPATSRGLVLNLIPDGAPVNLFSFQGTRNTPRSFFVAAWITAGEDGRYQPNLESAQAQVPVRDCNINPADTYFLSVEAIPKYGITVSRNNVYNQKSWYKARCEGSK